MAGTITIVNGPVKVDFDLNGLTGDTVDQILDRVLGDLNVPAGATPLVNGEPATGATIVQNGDELAFNKPTGQKG